MRLIDANALKKKIRKDYHPMDEIPFFEIMHIISNAPTIEERPKGKWEYTTHYSRRYRVCPICKAEKEDDHATGWNFCQYCGARME